MQQTPGYGAPASSPVFTHSGQIYLLGYTSQAYGIWDRRNPSVPVASFPVTDAGWGTAWQQFSAWEPAAVPVAQLQPAQVVFGVRRVNGDDPELVKFGRHDPAFFVRVSEGVARNAVFFNDVLRKAVDDLLGRGFAQHGRAAVARLVGGIPKDTVAIKVKGPLLFGGFDFLQAQYIGLLFVEERLQCILLDDSADAVDVP